MPTYTDTYSSTYLDTYGVPSGGSLSFPLAPLDLRCELELGGAWVDVSSKVYQREGTSPPVIITRGRPDETQTATPGSCAWQWNNRDGRFSPKNPLSPYYGLLTRNTPVRFSVPATGNYLRLETDASSCAAAADNAAMHVTGSFEARWFGRLTDWRGCFLMGRLDSTSTSAWFLVLRGDGTMRFGWWDSGGTEHQAISDAPLPYASGDFALKVTMDATTGTVTWYTAPSIGGTYAQLGDAVTVTGTATSVRAGSDPLRVGWSPSAFSDIGSGSSVQMYGRAYEVQLRNGIGGTIVADGLFSGQAAGTTSWTGTDGLSWITSGGGEISGRDYRYNGLMSSQPPKWDTTGNDMYVDAKAGGPLRILGQGSKPPVQSPIERAISLQSGSAQPIIYWPMEDAAGSSFFGAAIGGNPMTWVGATPTLATDSSFIASAPLPTLNGAALRGFVPSYAGGTTWSVTFLANIPTLPVSNQVFFQVDCAGDGLAAYIVFVIDSDGTVAITAVDGSLNIIADTGPVSVLAGLPAGIQQPLLWTMQATPSGSNVKYTLAAVAPGQSVGFAVSATSTATGNAGHVTFVTPGTYVGVWTDAVVGHVQVQDTALSIFALGSPLNAWIGEAAAVRFARLCGENGWPVRIKGSPAVSALMGAQGIDTLGNLLQECESADRGQMGEARECAGFSYRSLASMLNQSPVLTLSYTASQPGGVSSGSDSGLDPAYDDLLVRNDWTLTRGSSTGSQGATVRVTLNDGSEMSVTGLTDYGDSATVNVEADSQLADVAGWMVHVGTVDEHRWPVVPLNLARSEMAALQGAAMTVDAGDLVEIDSIPNTVLFDPVRQLALGFTEALGGKFWQMSYQEVPASPYTVITADDLVLGRVDTDGSSLASAATSTATTLSVATASGFPLWTTAAGDFPFDVAIAGERVTVTNITGSSSPQSFTVTRSVNGVAKAQSSGADVRLWTPPVLALT